MTDDPQFIVLFGPTLAAMCTSVCCFAKEFSKRMQALQRSLFDSGELAVTSLSHSRASSPRNFDVTPTDVGVEGHLSRRHTCVGHTCVVIYLR